MSEDTRKILIEALFELVGEGKKVNIKSVADRAGLSHSVIYNRYPDLKCIIKDEQTKQSERSQRDKDRAELEKLKNKLSSAKRKSQKLQQEQESEVPALLAHIQQVYSMYDQLAEEHVEALNKLRDNQTNVKY
ncbi:hypothetical protein FT643_09335 [Ketobacter sp. MCCC 1A13808]|uniref:DUF6262 family protein n=1 Tax=Ketobacter sp. MCCC 1A13808 TaxID=2602738 RepID=UPI0012EC3A22|nr:DUF6262 family protein [Ketobacter sp. MCCC 1A13808]MVF12347.1 hypothetical protein [Ketobacter sp. MCCC 1A13808]